VKALKAATDRFLLAVKLLPQFPPPDIERSGRGRICLLSQNHRAFQAQLSSKPMQSHSTPRCNTPKTRKLYFAKQAIASPSSSKKKLAWMIKPKLRKGQLPRSPRRPPERPKQSRSVRTISMLKMNNVPPIALETARTARDILGANGNRRRFTHHAPQ